MLLLLTKWSTEDTKFPIQKTLQTKTQSCRKLSNKLQNKWEKSGDERVKFHSLLISNCTQILLDLHQRLVNVANLGGQLALSFSAASSHFQQEIVGAAAWVIDWALGAAAALFPFLHPQKLFAICGGTCGGTGKNYFFTNQFGFLSILTQTLNLRVKDCFMILTFIIIKSKSRCKGKLATSFRKNQVGKFNET